MIPDDLEDFKDEIEKVECIMVNICKIHSPRVIYQACIRFICTLLVCEEEKEIGKIKFQEFYEKICDLCTTLKEGE